MGFLGFDVELALRRGRRQVETFCQSLFVFILLFSGLICLVLWWYLLFTPNYIYPVAYLLWYLYDRDSSRCGGYRVRYLSKVFLCKFLNDYFPLNLIKTAELDPNRNYVFGYHPHGILVVGAFNHFCTETSDFSKLFPGIRPHLLTLQGQFRFPVYREIILNFGLCSASSESIEHILTRQGKGNAAVLVIGGAKEQMTAHPGQPIRLTLKERKGFIRMALKHGSPLVPVFSFGENEVYSQVANPEGSLIRRIQTKLKDVLGFSPVLLKGCGFFENSVGILPYRKPIYTLVGRPIEVEHIFDPTEEDIDRYRDLYMQELRRLIDENRDKIGEEYRNIEVVL